MSSISAGTTSTTGYVVTSDTTGALVLKTGASATDAVILDTSQNFKMNSGYGSVATAYGCRAWVNFNGTGTVAIRASGNVSSITDVGVGSYTVNLTTAMPDVNYSTIGTCIGSGAATLQLDNTIRTVSAHSILTRAGSTVTDVDEVCVGFIR